jgi:hypothetical protein
LTLFPESMEFTEVKRSSLQDCNRVVQSIPYGMSSKNKNLVCYIFRLHSCQSSHIIHESSPIPIQQYVSQLLSPTCLIFVLPEVVFSIYETVTNLKLKKMSTFDFGLVHLPHIWKRGTIFMCIQVPMHLSKWLFSTYIKVKFSMKTFKFFIKISNYILNQWSNHTNKLLNLLTVDY